MSLLARKKLILAKVESTYGTDPTPTQAIQTSNLSITPLAGPTVAQSLDRSVLGNDKQIQVGTYVEVSFEVELSGSGTAGTAPVYQDLMLGCGLDETVVSSTSVTYAPVSTLFDSVALYFHHDGQKHIILGARGTVAINASPGTIPHLVFKYTGLYTTPTSVTDPTPDFSGFVTALAVNNTNMTTFSLHGVSSTMTDFSLDMACSVIYRNVVGDESVQLVDRAPAGSVTIETPAISAKDWFTAAQTSTTGALSVVHGTAAGNICTISAPNTQVISPNYGDSDGISTLQMGLALIPGTSGDDEISIAFT